MEFRSLYIIVSNIDEARRIAESLVEQRLAACANIIGGVESVYRWEGRIVRDNEVVMIAKTRADLVEPAIAHVKSVHSYTVPCVVALPVLAGSADYLQWLEAETCAG